MPDQCLVICTNSRGLWNSNKEKRKNRRCLKLSGSELKILQYADDTEIFATMEDSIKEIFNVIGKYERVYRRKNLCRKNGGVMARKLETKN